MAVQEWFGNGAGDAPALGRAIRLSTYVLPPVAAVAAFLRSARETALDALLAQGACGNLMMSVHGPLVFGHCADCYVAAARAAVFMLAALIAVDAISGAGAFTRRVNTGRS